jgi:hypothetical protein
MSCASKARSNSRRRPTNAFISSENRIALEIAQISSLISDPGVVIRGSVNSCSSATGKATPCSASRSVLVRKICGNRENSRSPFNSCFARTRAPNLVGARPRAFATISRSVMVLAFFWAGARWRGRHYLVFLCRISIMAFVPSASSHRTGFPQSWRSIHKHYPMSHPRWLEVFLCLLLFLECSHSIEAPPRSKRFADVGAR